MIINSIVALSAFAAFDILRVMHHDTYFNTDCRYTTVRHSPAPLVVACFAYLLIHSHRWSVGTVGFVGLALTPGKSNLHGYYINRTYTE